MTVGTATVGTQSETWVGIGEARDILSLPGNREVYRLIDLGLITVRRLPGVRPRLLRSDIERLKEEYTTSATTGGTGA